MPIPRPVFYPPFNITRAGHVRLTVRDLSASRDFYTAIYGLVVSDAVDGSLYLRGLEEGFHHSLVLRQTTDAPRCERIGLRVLTENELDKAAGLFKSLGLSPKWHDAPFQGRTLHVTDSQGVPLELCARIDRAERLNSAVNQHHGGAALRFDHFQILVPDVQKACDFYMPLGFRTSDYVEDDDGALVSAFMHRKDVPWDLVFFSGEGPRMHHFAYITPSAQDMFKACDIAGLFGHGAKVERGPGRHAMGHVQFVYFRDPDGHRSELILEAPHYMNDLENEPVRWDASAVNAKGWGLPAQHSWFFEASQFANSEIRPPMRERNVVTLERYLERGGSPTSAIDQSVGSS